MTCSIVALIACFSWSGFYVDGAAVVADGGIQRASDTYEFYGGKYHLVGAGQFDETASNPYGRFALGYEIELSPQFRAALEISHQSSLDTSKDRGVNSASLSVRWYPFRRRQ